MLPQGLYKTSLLQVRLPVCHDRTPKHAGRSRDAFGACAGNLVLEGGRDRVVFRLLMEVERLEATFNYESASAPPLLLAAIEDVRFNLSVNPGTLVINASLGNMRAQDCVLPEVTLLSSLAVQPNIYLGMLRSISMTCTAAPFPQCSLNLCCAPLVGHVQIDNLILL